MKIIKFGGKSLDNGKGINKVISIIKKYHASQEPFVVVVSARGSATDQLLELIDIATRRDDYTDKLHEFRIQQKQDSPISLEDAFHDLEKLLYGIQLIGECPEKTKDQIVSFGEVISTQYLAARLNEENIKSKAVDAGDLFVTDSHYTQANIFWEASENKTKAFFNSLDKNILPIVTGFLARNEAGERTTLGRNGSNYTASLLANFLDAEIFENYTHVDGIFTGNPDEIQEATKINHLSYSDASELAQFGANILHINTIEPLQKKNIPLRILNTFGSDEQTGTLISSNPEDKKVRALATLKDRALIHFEGKGLLGKIGVDARIFAAFQKANISVGMISQGSSERGIAMVVDESRAEEAVEMLKEAFKEESAEGDIIAIEAETNVGVLSIVGLPLNEFDKPYRALIRNQITPILFNNTTTGNTLCLLLKQEDLYKAIQVVHGELFDMPKTIHLALVGHGLVGNTLIEQILQQQQSLIKNKKLDIRIFAIANSTKLLLDANGVDKEWKSNKENTDCKYNSLSEIIEFADEHKLENLILVDNTANEEVAKTYKEFARHGFDIVSSNKIANTLPYESYLDLRKTLSKQKKKYYYETNVGAGLPLIDTLRLLHLSGENITRIKGVFSGSLSYLFNNYSVIDKSFSEVVLEAKEKGYTEPDPREDLSGNDVARKLLILARELDLPNELEDVVIQNLIPESLQNVDNQEFFERIEELDPIYKKVKENLANDEVLRYVGDLQYDPDSKTSTLEVKLIQVSKATALGQVKGADSIFEIYTESYGNHPLVIQGAGAGAKVTARGVFGDILRLSEMRD